MGYKAWPPNRGMRVKEREHMVRKQVNRKFGGESGSATRGGSGVWGRLVIACTNHVVFLRLLYSALLFSYLFVWIVSLLLSSVIC